ncbi:MAG: hypothetical protein IPH13_04865 [Planctomycetes bacterium]|nr:hypothetical protein [Planctomycetota bacterium]MCC7172546.1 hypothetical protein [Planctomycetota bacterium]
MSACTNRWRGLLVLFVACISIAAAPGRGTTRSDRSSTHAIVVREDHKHRYVKVPDGKVWVPPKTAKKVVGYDAKGKPIYREVVVSPGYYRTKYVDKCNVCGKLKG